MDSVTVANQECKYIFDNQTLLNPQTTRQYFVPNRTV